MAAPLVLIPFERDADVMVAFQMFPNIETLDRYQIVKCLMIYDTEIKDLRNKAR